MTLLARMLGPGSLEETWLCWTPSPPFASSTSLSTSSSSSSLYPSRIHQFYHFLHQLRWLAAAATSRRIISLHKFTAHCYAAIYNVGGLIMHQMSHSYLSITCLQIKCVTYRRRRDLCGMLRCNPMPLYNAQWNSTVHLTPAPHASPATRSRSAKQLRRPVQSRTSFSCNPHRLKPVFNN